MWGQCWALCVVEPCRPRETTAAVGPGEELAADGRGQRESKMSALMLYKSCRECPAYPVDLERPSDWVGSANNGRVCRWLRQATRQEVSLDGSQGSVLPSINSQRHMAKGK